MSQFNKVALSILLFIGSSQCLANVEAVELQQSLNPIFIDGVHCEGVKLNADEHAPLSNNGNKESKENKIQNENIKKWNNHQICKNIFSSFGIELFQWYSPEDLNLMVDIIKKSQDLNTTDFQIKKTELANHVQLFLKIAPNTQNIKSITFENKDYIKTKKESGRITSLLGIDMKNRELFPFITNNYGFKHFDSRADTSVDNFDSILDSQYSQIYKMNRIEKNELYYNLQTEFGSNGTSINGGVDLLMSNLNTSQHSRPDFIVTIGYNKIQYGLLGKSQWGIFIEHDVVTNFDYETSLFSNKSTTSNRDRLKLMLSSHAGNPKENYFDSSIFAIATRNSVENVFIEYQLDYRWTRDSSFVPQAYFLYKGIPDETSDIGLIRQFMDHDKNKIELGGNKYFSTSYGNLQLSGFCGYESNTITINNDGTTQSTFNRGSIFGGIKTKLATLDGWDIDAKLTSYSDRLQ